MKYKPGDILKRKKEYRGYLFKAIQVAEQCQDTCWWYRRYFLDTDRASKEMYHGEDHTIEEIYELRRISR